MRVIILLLLSSLSVMAQTPIVFHAVNCQTVQSEDRCVGCTSPLVSVYTCDGYLTGGSGSLWPSQASPAKLISLEPIIDGVLPPSLTIDPNSGLVITPNPVGPLNPGTLPIGCNVNLQTGLVTCGIPPVPPVNLSIEVI